MNLYTYYNVYNSTSLDVFKKYMKQEHGVEQKDEDIKNFAVFFEKLIQNDFDISLLNDIWLEYTIPHISKEFDLLRISENLIVNIEIKSESTLEKINRQLTRNSYYLKGTGIDFICFTYIVKDDILYVFRENEIVETSYDELKNSFQMQEKIYTDDLNLLFNPLQFLISPFNSTERFLDENYFLTSQQEEIEKEIIKIIKENKNKFCVLGVKGKAGTGKSLLIYDITKKVMSDEMSVGIIHCGYLNDGHNKLKQHGYNIFSAKEYEKVYDYDVIIIDESQRFWPEQMLNLIKYSKFNNKICIFSYDQEQIFESNEEMWNNSEKIESYAYKVFYLSNKIRVNDKMSAFIHGLFNLNKINKSYNYDNVEIVHFRDYSSAKKFIRFKRKNNCKFLNYTGSYSSVDPEIIRKFPIGKENNSHHIIGQEFDDVIVALDDTFFYKDKKLYSKKWNNVRFNGVKMLYQNITRVRNKLYIVIINNEMLFEQILSIKVSNNREKL